MIAPLLIAPHRPIHPSAHRSPSYRSARTGLAININLVHPKLGTPLFIACRYGQEKLVSRLLDLGADPNLVTEDGRSAFYMASEFGQDKVVKLLLDRWPPLPLRERMQRADVAAADAARLASAAVAAAGNAGAAEVARAASSARSGVSIVQPGEKTIDVDRTTDSGKTALFIACEKGLADVVNVLLHHGEADARKPTALNKAPLYAAAEGGHEAVLKALLPFCKPSDVLKCTNFGTTPLFIAQRIGHKGIKRLLTEFCVNDMRAVEKKVRSEKCGKKQGEYMSRLTSKKKSSAVRGHQEQERQRKAEEFDREIDLANDRIDEIAAEMKTVTVNTTERRRSWRDRAEMAESNGGKAGGAAAGSAAAAGGKGGKGGGRQRSTSRAKRLSKGLSKTVGGRSSKALDVVDRLAAAYGDEMKGEVATTSAPKAAGFDAELGAGAGTGAGKKKKKRKKRGEGGRAAYASTTNASAAREGGTSDLYRQSRRQAGDSRMREADSREGGGGGVGGGGSEGALLAELMNSLGPVGDARRVLDTGGSSGSGFDGDGGVAKEETVEQKQRRQERRAMALQRRRQCIEAGRSGNGNDGGGDDGESEQLGKTGTEELPPTPQSAPAMCSSPHSSSESKGSVLATDPRVDAQGPPDLGLSRKAPQVDNLVRPPADPPGEPSAISIERRSVNGVPMSLNTDAVNSSKSRDRLAEARQWAEENPSSPDRSDPLFAGADGGGKVSTLSDILQEESQRAEDDADRHARRERLGRDSDRLTRLKAGVLGRNRSASASEEAAATDGARGEDKCKLQMPVVPVQARATKDRSSGGIRRASGLADVPALSPNRLPDVSSPSRRAKKTPRGGWEVRSITIRMVFVFDQPAVVVVCHFDSWCKQNTLRVLYVAVIVMYSRPSADHPPPLTACKYVFLSSHLCELCIAASHSLTRSRARAV